MGPHRVLMGRAESKAVQYRLHPLAHGTLGTTIRSSPHYRCWKTVSVNASLGWASWVEMKRWDSCFLLVLP